MKKDIEWLKKEIGTEMIELEPNRKEKWSDVKYQTLRSVAQKIDQLDEPEVKQLERKIRELASFNDELIRDNNQLRNELDNQEVLSQEWIDKNVIHIRGFGDIFKAEDVEGILVPKQESEVLSQEWISDNAVVDEEWHEVYMDGNMNHGQGRRGQ